MTEPKPLRLIIHGPPASGKTTLAKRISRHYGAIYVSIQTMIEDTLENLRAQIVYQQNLKMKEPISEDDAEDEEEPEVEDLGEEEPNLNQREIQACEDQIRDITSLLTRGKLPDEYVVRLMKTFLATPHIQNHGYILDGYPKTLQTARELFGQVADIEQQPPEEMATPAADVEEGEDGGQLGDFLGNAAVNIMPNYVISLQATDEFLCNRIMQLPEKLVQLNKHYQEDVMVHRLIEYRMENTPDSTPLNFFDESNVHPIIIDLDDDDDLECIVTILYEQFGPPIPGLGLSAEEEMELVRMEIERKKLAQQAYMIEKQLAEEDAQKAYEDKMEEWAVTMEKLQFEEEKIMAAESEPLRYYLMKYVFPTLTRGLQDVVKVKPDDPVDYLAEFLFKENPEGRMFDPSYTRSGEEILKEALKKAE